MYVVDGLISGEKLKKDLMLSLRGNNKLTGYDGSKQISVELTNNVLSVDIVHETNATGGGASGAAGGAVLGFLLAGPAGTLIGAAAGSKKKGQDSITIALRLVSGDTLVLRKVSSEDVGILAGLKITTKNALELEAKKRESEKAIEQIQIQPDPNEYQPVELGPVIRGRSKLNKKLPLLPYIDVLEANTTSKAIIDRRIAERAIKHLNEYSTFKWRYFDEELTEHSECEKVVEFAVRQVAYEINKAKKLREKVIASREREKEEHRYLDEDKAKLASLTEDLKAKGFFSGRQIKREIAELKESIELAEYFLNEDSLLPAWEEELSKYDEILEISSVTDELGSSAGRFLSEANRVSFCITKGRRASNPTKKDFLEVFNSQKQAEFETAAIGSSQVANASVAGEMSTKEKLIELKELLDLKLISDEEFEEKRKALLEAL